jgi:hypothetical protein
MYMYVRTCVCIYVLRPMYIPTYVCAFVYMYKCMCVCICIWVYVCSTSRMQSKILPVRQWLVFVREYSLRKKDANQQAWSLKKVHGPVAGVGER